MDLLDRLLQHDAWTTRQLLDLCATLNDQQLDHPFDIGHRTLRATLDHIIHNMETWSRLMAGQSATRQTDCTVPGMIDRLSTAAAQLADVARRIAEQDAWDDAWIDHLDDPPQEKTYGAAIAHVLTHSMHHRAQVLYMLRRTGVRGLPEGDVFTWESQLDRS